MTPGGKRFSISELDQTARIDRCKRMNFGRMRDVNTDKEWEMIESHSAGRDARITVNYHGAFNFVGN